MIALPSREIILPGSALWDRAAAFLSKGKRAANGKLCRRPNGKGATTSCCSGCTICVNDTQSVSVTFNAVVCTGCWFFSHPGVPGGFASYKGNTGTFTGTYSAPKVALVDCFWSSFPSVGTPTPYLGSEFELHSNNSCTAIGSPLIAVSVQRLSATSCRVVGSAFLLAGGIYSGVTLFSKTETISSCDDAFTVTGTSATCANGTSQMQQGGTADVVF